MIFSISNTFMGRTFLYPDLEDLRYKPFETIASKEDGLGHDKFVFVTSQ
jgi:hypothetical protein